MVPEVLSYLCPFCDRQVRVGSRCPGCVKKAKLAKRQKRSWEQAPGKDGLDLPDDDFDYDSFVTREFGKAPHQALGLRWYWWLLGVVVLAGMVASAFWLG
ncbi:hypothetical protein HQ447_17550 [bacterium]|nr:hypothetical protein [bacterium]